MLYQFEVSGFKSFNEKFSFRLDGAKEYSCNREAVRNDVIKTGIVYGVNGIGKKSCGAIEIDEYLTDNFQCPAAFSKEPIAEPIKVHQQNNDAYRPHKSHYFG